MSDHRDAAASAGVRTSQSRRTLLAGGAVLAIGLPLMSFARPQAQDAPAGIKDKLNRGATEILGRHSVAHGDVLIYIVLQDIPESNWGFLGETADLKAMQAAPPTGLPSESPINARFEARRD